MAGDPGSSRANLALAVEGGLSKVHGATVVVRDPGNFENSGCGLVDLWYA